MGMAAMSVSRCRSSSDFGVRFLHLAASELRRFLFALRIASRPPRLPRALGGDRLALAGTAASKLGGACLRLWYRGGVSRGFGTNVAARWIPARREPWERKSPRGFDRDGGAARHRTRMARRSFFRCVGV